MSQSFDISQAHLPKAQEEMGRWHSEQQALLKELLSEPLRILVWGPGNVAPEAQGQERKKAVVQKRIQIRDELNKCGHTAIFSEDWPSDRRNIPVHIWEYTQADTAHLIILLIEESAGGLGEMHDFANHKDIVRKMLVMIPRRYELSYSAMGVVYLLDKDDRSVYWYADNEIEDCQVLTEALNRAEMMRYAAAMRKRVGRTR
jgi:hypothetical protein